MRPEGHTIEDEGAKKKWDAWKREEGVSKTEAKRQYILYLINTMRVYASGTSEARELLNELEYLWDQIKDLTYSDDDPYAPRHQVATHPFMSQLTGAPLVHSYMELDRFSVGTPWPLHSTGSISASHQMKNNSEQIYLHSRRNTQQSLNDSANLPRSHHKNISRSVVLLGRSGNNQVEVPPSTIEDFRTWQSQINLIINKLSRDFASRKTSQNHSDSDSETELDRTHDNWSKVLRLLKFTGMHLIRLAQNMSISLLAILFVVWCVNRNVIVKRTIVKKQLEGNKTLKELVINMIINTDENKWFVQILTLVNKIVGFV